MTPGNVCQSVIGALRSSGFQVTAANRRCCLFSFVRQQHAGRLPALPVELLNCQEEEKVKASRVYFDEHSSPPSPQLEPHAERLQREEGRRRDLITRYSGALKVVRSSAKTLISSALHPRSYLSRYGLNIIIY